MGGGKPQQASDFFTVAKVFCRAFFQYSTKLIPEALVLIAVFLGQLGQHVQHPLGHGGADALHGAVVLQNFARYVQGKIVGIDHALGETQIQRQELLGVVHDEHTLHVQFQATGRFPVVQVERRALGDVQQAGVVQLAFYLVVGPGQRVFKIVGDVFVEFLVLFVFDLGTRQCPQGGGIVYRLFFALLVLFFRFGLHYHRERDVVRVLLHQAAQLPAIGKLFVFGFQVQHDFSTALFTAHRLDGELTIAPGFPVHALLYRCPGLTGKHVHFVRHDEGGVETHTKLADQLAVFLFVARQLLEELGCTGAGDGAKVGNHIVTGHADAVVSNGDGAGVFVVIQADFEFGIAFVEFVVFQGGEAEFVFGV